MLAFPASITWNGSEYGVVWADARDSTTGKPKPLGERGAWAADNVAIDETVQSRPEEAREGEKLTAASPTVADADERGP